MVQCLNFHWSTWFVLKKSKYTHFVQSCCFSILIPIFLLEEYLILLNKISFFFPLSEISVNLKEIISVTFRVSTNLELILNLKLILENLEKPWFLETWDPKNRFFELLVFLKTNILNYSYRFITSVNFFLLRQYCTWNLFLNSKVVVLTQPSFLSKNILLKKHWISPKMSLQKHWKPWNFYFWKKVF